MKNSRENRNNCKTQGNFGTKTQENSQNSSFRKICLRTWPARLRKKKPDIRPQTNASGSHQKPERIPK